MVYNTDEAGEQNKKFWRNLWREEAWAKSTSKEKRYEYNKDSSYDGNDTWEDSLAIRERPQETVLKLNAPV